MSQIDYMSQLPFVDHKNNPIDCAENIKEIMHRLGVDLRLGARDIKHLRLNGYHYSARPGIIWPLNKSRDQKKLMRDFISECQKFNFPSSNIKPFLSVIACDQYIKDQSNQP